MGYDEEVPFIPQGYPLFALFDKDEWHDHSSGDGEGDCGSPSVCAVIGWYNGSPMLHDLDVKDHPDGGLFWPVGGEYLLSHELPDKLKQESFATNRCNHVRMIEEYVQRRNGGHVAA